MTPNARLVAAALIISAVGYAVSATADESSVEKAFKKLLYDRIGAD
jgi:hypothetical protein